MIGSQNKIAHKGSEQQKNDLGSSSSKLTRSFPIIKKWLFGVKRNRQKQYLKVNQKTNNHEKKTSDIQNYRHKIKNKKWQGSGHIMKGSRGKREGQKKTESENGVKRPGTLFFRIGKQS